MSQNWILGCIGASFDDTHVPSSLKLRLKYPIRHCKLTCNEFGNRPLRSGGRPSQVYCIPWHLIGLQHLVPNLFQNWKNHLLNLIAIAIGKKKRCFHTPKSLTLTQSTNKVLSHSQGYLSTLSSKRFSFFSTSIISLPVPGSAVQSLWAIPVCQSRKCWTWWILVNAWGK